MASRFDYPDPGTDPEYCNALAPEPEDTEPEVYELSADTAVCAWCGERLYDDNFTPFCSSLCAIRAELDSID